MRPVLALALSTLAGLLSLTGCSKTADGGACAEDGDCSSERCLQGYCAGSECSCGRVECNAVASEDCETGWVCVYTDPVISISIAGSDDNHNRCEPTCGSCPANMHCDPGATGLCQYGFAPPTVDGGGPYTGVAGEPVALHATASSAAGSITRVEWSLPSGTIEGADVSAVFDGAGHYTIGVAATDDHGATANDSAEVDICASAGSACYDGSSCCSYNCNTQGTCD